ncbi:hypothetical protein BH10BAC3_BH10BAC3_30750 [soil metagenome]
MKKIILAFLLIPFLGMAQTKNVVSLQRIFPKVDKVGEFEKALGAHAQKYHSGLWKWRVYEIQSGPDFGGYMIVEGPNSWEDFGNRGDLGAEHTTDWNKNVAGLLAQEGQSYYMEFREEFSNVAITDYSKWITISHLYQNPGYLGDLEDMLAQMKKTWVVGNESVAVYNSNASGAPQFAVVTRYKQGLKEKDIHFRPDTFKDRFTKANGDGSFEKWRDTYRAAINKQWSELLMYREDMSSK